MKITSAKGVKDSGPLQMMVDVVPDNFFHSASNNKNMLQIIFFSVLFGVALLGRYGDLWRKGIGILYFIIGICHLIAKKLLHHQKLLYREIFHGASIFTFFSVTSPGILIAKPGPGKGCLFSLLFDKDN